LSATVIIPRAGAILFFDLPQILLSKVLLDNHLRATSVTLGPMIPSLLHPCDCSCEQSNTDAASSVVDAASAAEIASLLGEVASQMRAAS
jgi:hypothetical protein